MTASEARRIMRGFGVSWGNVSHASGRLLLPPYQLSPGDGSVAELTAGIGAVLPRDEFADLGGMRRIMSLHEGVDYWIFVEIGRPGDFIRAGTR